MWQALSRLRNGLVLLALILIVGMIGFMVLEDQPPLQALYAAVLVVSTLGFNTFAPETTGGILLTIGMILSGVGTLYYLLGRFAEALIETSLGTRHERRMERQISHLRKHHIVCGFGRVGQHAARELHNERQAFVVVDNHAEALDVARAAGYLVLLGDATDDQVLRRAGVERARGLLVTTASDSANVFITLTARSFNPQLMIVARASIETSESKLLKAGANRVIAPEVVGGQRMAALVLRPESTSVVDELMLTRNEQSWIDEAVIGEHSPLCGQTLEQAAIYRATGATVIAIRHADGVLITNPQNSEVLRPGDVLVTMGDHDQLLRLERWVRTNGEQVEGEI
jgi:voltage-gated potassium channel